MGHYGPYLTLKFSLPLTSVPTALGFAIPLGPLQVPLQFCSWPFFPPFFLWLLSPPPLALIPEYLRMPPNPYLQGNSSPGARPMWPIPQGVCFTGAHLPPLPHWLLLLGSQTALGFSGGLDGKESACSAGDMGLITRLGISLGEGNGYPLRYSCLENSMDRGTWRVTVSEVTKSQTHLCNWHFHFQTIIPTWLCKALYLPLPSP